MNWRINRKPFAYLLTASLLTGLVACSKGDELNVDLPGTAGIGTNYVDLPLSAFHVVRQPIQTIKAQHYLVGRLRDQLTGQTEARAVLNLLAVSANDSLPGRFTVAGNGPDSVVIQLAYDQVYGTSNQPARLDVLELTDPLAERAVYNSTTVVGTSPTSILTNASVPLNRTRAIRQAIATSPTDSVTVLVPDRSVSLVVQRRGRNTNPNYPNVASPWADKLYRLLNAPSLTQAQLDATVGGLVLAPNATYPNASNPNPTLINSGAVLSFSRVVNAAVVVYFSEPAITPATVGRRHTYQLPFGPAANGSTGPGSPNDPRYFTQLNTDFSSSSALNGLSPGSKLSVSASSGVGYAQEGTALGLLVQFDNAVFQNTLNKPGIAINRAELVLPVKPYSNVLLSNPPALYALEVDAQNNVLQRVNGLIAADRIVQADGFSQVGQGAEARAVLVNASATNAYYSLPITSYLQAYINNAAAGTLGPLPNGLLLTPALSTATSLTLNRAVIQADQAKLRVYYSQLRK